MSRAEPLRLAALGDSLTAGWGLRVDESFAALLEAELRKRGRDVTILNYGVSGDTTAGGLSRLGQVLGIKPDGVILELGANDGLRGFEPAFVAKNLETMIRALTDHGVPVLLAGMYALTNMGRDYAAEFKAIYPNLAERHGLMLYPFFLDGVAGQRDLNQPDGLHPNAQGVREIVRRILPTVEAFLDGIEAARREKGRP